ncbi:MAG: hypothetical protein ACTSO7_03895 [Candidatus Heimdallarchaeota archaeon]
MVGVNVVSGIVPDKINSIESQDMIPSPINRIKTWEMVTGGGGSYGYYNKPEFSEFFFNFSMTSNSTGSIELNFDSLIAGIYSPNLVDRTFSPGESYSGNFTYTGELTGRASIEYMNFLFSLVTGDYAYFIFEMIIWDNLVYKPGLGLYLTIGILTVLAIIVVIVLVRHSKGKSSPKLT